MFGFVTDLYNSVTGNSGSKSATDSAKAGLVDQMGTASETRAGANNVQGSNTAAGFTGPMPTGTVPGGTDLDTNRFTLNKSPQIVGTTVNENRPDGGSDMDFQGFPSIMNPYHLVRYHSHMKGNEGSAPHVSDLNTPEESIDYKGLADLPEYKNPSTSLIIAHFSDVGPAKAKPEARYSYADFLYLKEYHPFNNNRLITLRRFMAPVYDELRVAVKNKGDEKSPIRKPIAQAISYLDTSGNKLSDFTKMTVGIPTKTTSGAIDNTTTITGVEELITSLGGSGTKGGSGTGSDALTKVISLLSGTEGNIGNFNAWTSTYDPWKTGPLQDLVYGPVNVITGALIRGQGLTFTHTKFEVGFEYSSKTIESVNQKAAMLDILSNTLALTYNRALFWGGENRFLIERGNFPLLRAELVFSLLNNLDNPDEALKQISEQLGVSAKAVADKTKDIFSKVAKEDNIVDVLKNNGSAITEALANVAFAENSKLQKVQRQILEGMKAELTGAPTGEWHLQVGNPFAPIMMIGNLWCTSTTFEFNDELSIDDFPTEFKFTCTLSHGRKRDSSDIQSIFNTGGGSIYYPYKDAKTNVNESFSTYNTESQYKLKRTDVKNYDGRVSVDRSGTKISEAVKTYQKVDKNSEIKRQVFQPIYTTFKK